MSRFLSIALLFLSNILVAQADIYSASNALSRGDYETAVAEFTELAEKGDASAQANLGYMYYAGEGVPQDYEKAVYWYRKAATQGNKDAQYNLAVSYAFGEGVKQDLTEAAIWYRRAGEQGHVVSQYSLGISYAYGEGVPQDQKEAARWFKKAAEQGYARAQVHLGSMHHTGEGVDQDYTEAVRWYRMAADRGDATAQYNLGAMYRSGKGVEQNYAQAKRWFRQSADQGYAAAQNELASLERSAAANIATRTIQTKPELPTIAETTATPDPTPVKKAEPVPEPAEKVEEKVAVQKTEPEAIETTSLETTEKKPLFSVEKEGLLSLDETELDIAELEVTPESVEEPVIEETVSQTEQVTEPAPFETKEEETEVKVTQTVEVEDSSAISRALGVPTQKETDGETETSEGFFSKLFGKKEEPDTGEAYLFDQEEIAAEYANDRYIEEINNESTTETKTTDDVSKEVTQVEEETVTSEGFFSKLFSKKEESDTGEAYLFDQEEIAAEYANDKYIEEINNESTTETKTTDDVLKEVTQVEETEVIETEPREIAEVTESTSNNNAIHNALGLPAPKETNEETKSSEGFFDKLFAEKEPTETEETLAEVIEEEPVIEETEDKVTQTVQADDSSAIHNALGLPPAPIESDEGAEPTEGFFDKLFAKKEPTETDNSEQIAETVEEKVVEEITPEPEVEVADNNWADADADIAETEENKSGGLFSAIGDFFSGGDKSDDISINETEIETESDNELIAKVEEPVPVVEEIELAQEAETDLSQYSVLAGRRALTNGDFDEALKQFKPLAEAGDSEAQSHMGSLYYVGKGVPKDLNEAYNWYKKSADQGNMDAQYSIGNMYLLGEGTEQNNSSAAKWYTLASEQGHNAAKNNLKSLEKLEALNRENQLKLDAIAAEEKAKKESIPEEIVEPEEVATLDEETIAADTETVKEEKTGLIGLIGGLFGSKSPESDVTEETQETIAEVTPEEAKEIEIVERELPPIDPSQTLVEEETIDTSTSEIDSITKETELSNNITSVDAPQPKTSESPGFFESLFGSNEAEKTNEVSNIELESSEQIESNDVESDEPIEIAKVETNTDELVNQIDEVPEETTDEVENVEESGGLFGFLGDVFSSDKNEGQTNIDPEVSEEVAMLETESESVSSIDEVVTEELVEEMTVATEFERLRPLATQGDQDAQYKLGALYYSGKDVKQDFSQAALWYRRAAQQGNVDAQFSLGNMFLMGEGVGQDDTQAANWYSLAAEQGHSSAKNNLESLKQMVQANTPVETETTVNSGQLISLDDEDTFEKADSDNSGKSEYEQGLAYAFGDGVPQNDRTAFNLFYEAAEKGYVLAQYKLGVCFSYGEGVRQDQKKAVEWYRKAAEQGHTIAQRNLALMYLEGKGVEQNKVQALAWYQVVANAGNAMDLRRRDMLKKELSDVELSQSQELSNQISSRITNPSL
jgi:TPR repeat protein